MAEISKHLIVKGRVQGVNFRSSVKKIADALGINGWIRNEVDGNVSIVCQGDEEVLKNFILEIGEGPGLSNVGEIVEKKTAIGEKLSGFNIVREGGFFSDQKLSFKNLGKEILGN